MRAEKTRQLLRLLGGSACWTEAIRSPLLGCFPLRLQSSQLRSSGLCGRAPSWRRLVLPLLRCSQNGLRRNSQVTGSIGSLRAL